MILKPSLSTKIWKASFSVSQEGIEVVEAGKSISIDFVGKTM